MPCSVPRKMKVKASRGRSVPNQTNLERCTSRLGRRCGASSRLAVELTPSAATTRSGALRSTTVISWAGSARLASSAKYSPAGPPPRTPMRIPAPSGEDVGQAVELGRVGDGGQQDQVVAAGLGVAADEVPDRPATGEVAGGDPGREGAGEGVVVAQVGVAGLGVAKGEVALAPQLGS